MFSNARCGAGWGDIFRAQGCASTLAVLSFRPSGGEHTRTVDAYRTDVSGFLAFLQGHLGDAAGTVVLGKLSTRDMRAWMAHERGRGVSRAVAGAVSFSGEKLRWLAGRAEGFRSDGSVLMTRTPRFQKKLPRPLDVSAARAMIGYCRHSVDHRLGCAARRGRRDAALWVRIADFRSFGADAELLCRWAI